MQETRYGFWKKQWQVYRAAKESVQGRRERAPSGIPVWEEMIERIFCGLVEGCIERS